jgi:hypothetical protein
MPQENVNAPDGKALSASCTASSASSTLMVIDDLHPILNERSKPSQVVRS